ncbi:hypothetical protein SADUNF_Sadunf03G0127400 [Salix dunnii]|uniref:BAR domain-containing protein n=1 Tax=Salix dunnii TaxID=1413687 RepID=A0A835N4K1_9ROSI|nr:hypothetical protein SADUNF_Sadunf03G0127400 [Salix dunnii]
MKSLKKLRGFASLHRQAAHKNPRDRLSFSQSHELARASQDMLDMKDCYDSLLSAAAGTANCAFEFSESLREMGACLLAKTALNDDEESGQEAEVVSVFFTGRVLLMLGKAQFELHKLVDCYRSHINQTIISPSESLMSELQTVEEMKQQCDEKRDVYAHMVRQRERASGRNGKGECFSMQQIQAAHDEYDEDATLFVFRLKSLKQGQSRSLLTQAARHHAAQLCFFKKALKSLEAVEPHVKVVSEQQHIDYHFSGLDEDWRDDDDYDDDEDYDDANDDGELSFDYGQNDQEQEVSKSIKQMELDLPQVEILEMAKENLDKSYRTSFSFKGEHSTGTQSAPLFAEVKSDPSGKTKLTLSSTRKFNTYVLPTPVNPKSSNSTGPRCPVSPTLKTSLSGRTLNFWHSSPLGPEKNNTLLGVEMSSKPTAINLHSVLKESNNTASTRLSPPLADGLLFSRLEPLAASESKKIKRYAFSGPLTSRPWSTKPVSAEHPQLFSGPLLQNPTAQLLSSPPKVSARISPKVSPSASPPFVSSPKISELHELPRPPVSSTSKSPRAVGLVGHSAPLLPKGRMLPGTSETSASNVECQLPTPSQVVPRSFSIPSRTHRVVATQNSGIVEDVASPPLTPISLSNIPPSSTDS